MNRLLQDNPIGLALAGLAAFLLLCIIIIGAWSFFPVGDGDLEDVSLGEDSLIRIPELAESQPVENYSVIVQRPLFNETRLPVIEADLEPEEPVEEVVTADETELEVELSGIVITPTLRMATLKRTDGSKSLVAIEGRYLEGEFGSWQLTRVDNRQVLLTSGSGKELRLELQVHDERIEPPELPAEPEGEQVATTEQAEASQEEAAPMTRADEIRQRIAERREQLRREAEEADRAGQNNAEPSYEQAIRAMINRQPAPKEEPENEQ